MRTSPALLGLLLACDFASSSQADGDESTQASGQAGRAVDRGLILSKPTVPLAASLAVPAPEEPTADPDGEPTSIDLSMESLEAALRERLPEHRLACARVKRLPCRRIGDLDGDGAKDIVVLVEPVTSRAVGLAVLWGHGGADVLGAGRRGQKWLVQKETSSEREPIPFDLSTLGRWSVWAADGPPEARRGFIDPRTRRFRVPAVRGDGIMLDGGDAASIAYHDGKGWRLHYLGF